MSYLWLYFKWAVKILLIMLGTVAKVIGTFAILTGIVWAILEFILLPLLLIPFGLGCILIAVLLDMLVEGITKKWRWKV